MVGPGLTFREIRFTIEDYLPLNNSTIEIIAEYTLTDSINTSIGANTFELTGMAEFYLSTENNESTWRPSEELNTIDLVGKEKRELPLKEIVLGDCNKKYEYSENYFVGRDYNYDTFIHEYREWFGNNFMYSPVIDPDFAYIAGTAKILSLIHI